MNIKDLQVGNYVLCGGTVKKTYIVTAISIADLVTIQNDDEELDGCLSDRIFPIPITKEMLLKNGWIEREDDLVLLQEGFSIRMTSIGGISLFVNNDIFEDFVVKLKAVVSAINADFPRSKPFEVYSVSEYGITITVAGTPEKVVAHMSTATIKCFVSEGDIYPIEDLILQIGE